MPSLFSLPNAVPVATGEIVPINIDFAAYLVAGDALSTAVSKLTQDGSGSPSTPADAPTILRTTVAASPAPTTTVFSVQPGVGKQLLAFAQGPLGAAMVLTVGAQLAAVQSIIGDVVTLATPLSSAPAAGDAVTSSFVQQIVRGSQLSARQSYRLDVSATLSASPAKVMTVSVGIPCPY